MARSGGRRWLALCSLLLLGPAPAAAEPAHEPGAALRVADADAAADETLSAPAADALDATDAYRLALLRIKGHLSVARALLQVRAPGADHHLREPVRAIFESIAAALDNRNAPLTDDILVQLERATDATPQAALATIDSAAAAIDGSFAQTGAMQARSALSLSEALLREAVELYADSVSDNEVVDVPAYRTGRGLVVQAEALVRHSSGLKGQPGHDALLAAVVLIRQAWPGVRPPPIVFDPRTVAGRLDEAVAAMDALR